MFKILALMSSTLLLYPLNVYADIQCSMWRDIKPCTCRIPNAMDRETRIISITCENMSSYGQVVDLLKGRFTSRDQLRLKLERSNLQDLQYRSFRELNVTIDELRLNHDYLGLLNEDSFDGLTTIKYLSLADTPLENVPLHLWNKMPFIRTNDLGRTKIREITYTSFRGLQEVQCIVVAGNQISRIDRNAFPITLNKLHLGRNRIQHLNETLTELRELTWLFLNSNDLEDIDGQLPYEAPNLKMIHAANNRLIKIPTQMNYPLLDTLFLTHNQITRLDAALSKCKGLVRLWLDENHIHTITPEDFEALENLDTLILANNQITTLNNSLLSLKNLHFLDITNNLLTEFSFHEIMGLQKLRRLDLSYNQISNLIGPATNLVEPNIKLINLKLHHNQLETLNSALSGLSELLRLDLSHNRLRRISPEDFINLDQLRLLDISHNQLTTLEEMSKTYLPRLQELKASHNYLTILERDFHGLPVLCDADLSSNRIVALGRELVTKTRCKIAHGVHEGSWDTLKIYLQDNPILCDAALPEITSEMETNHTRIYGVSHCPPLSEQPVTARPNGFLGYVPEPVSPPILPPIYGKPTFDPKPLLHHTNVEILETPNQIQPNIYTEVREPILGLRPNDQYHTIDHFEGGLSAVIKQPQNDEHITVTVQKPLTSSENVTQEVKSAFAVNSTEPMFDPVVQGKVINKLASEIEELRTRIDQLSSQNEMLFNMTTMEHKNATIKVP